MVIRLWPGCTICPGSTDLRVTTPSTGATMRGVAELQFGGGEIGAGGFDAGGGGAGFGAAHVHLFAIGLRRLHLGAAPRPRCDCAALHGGLADAGGLLDAMASCSWAARSSLSATRAAAW